MSVLVPPPGVEVFPWSGGRSWFHEGIVFQTIVIPRVEVDHVVELEEVSLRLIGERKRVPALVDVRAVRWASSAARVRGGNAIQSEVRSAVALLVESPVTRMVGSIFIRVSSPPMPTRLFDTEGAALAWLQPYRSVEP